MKTLTAFLGILALMFALSASLYAQCGMMGGGYGGGGMGPGMMGGGWNYCPNCGAYQGGYGMGGRGYGPGRGYGVQGQSQACRSFLNETQSLRRDLVNKRFEYSEAMQNPKTSPEALSTLEKQVDDLQGKIQAKNTQNCQW